MQKKKKKLKLKFFLKKIIIIKTSIHTVNNNGTLEYEIFNPFQHYVNEHGKSENIKVKV